MVQDHRQVIVIGGGLAGLSSCHQVIQRGGNVLLLDKNPFLGGNSTKATSGINGTLTQAQIKNKVQDSVDIFAKDTALGAGIKDGNASPLQWKLCKESGPAIEWLQEYFALDLSLVSQLGGHSFPRTHRGPEKFPGMTITYALMEHLEKIEAESKGKRAKIVMSARVVNLLQDNKGTVNGVEYEQAGKIVKAYGPVVIASGGYGADFSSDSLMTKYRPDLLKLSTTNGDHCTGDGIKMAQAIGANAVDMSFVQVHPTGLVDPADPNAKVKFLAAEALRGVGALLLDGNGSRFVNELGTRDYVSEVMTKNKGPFRLVLNGKASKEIEWHCKHYVGRGLMKRFSGAELAKEIGVPAEKLAQTFSKYNDAAKKGSDEFGKKYFHNFPFGMEEVFHVAQVCPLIHYCMGGVEIDQDGRVKDTKGKIIAGLFAAGEVTGGLHMKNRLGGSSLTDCVVFGRVAGGTAAAYLFSQLANQEGTIGAGNAWVNLSVNPSSKQIVLSFDNNAAATTTTATEEQPAAAAAAPEKKEKKELKNYTLDDVAKHNKENDCWVVVNGQVLDVTGFMARHPGGKKAILLFAGKDATEEFNMLHDANVIEKYAPETIVGNLVGAKAAHSKL